MAKERKRWTTGNWDVIGEYGASNLSKDAGC